jgi:hypothetical protein
MVKRARLYIRYSSNEREGLGISNFIWYIIRISEAIAIGYIRNALQIRYSVLEGQ